MNWLKKLMLLRLFILVIQLKKLTITQKLVKLKKMSDLRKYIITPEFNKLTTENFTVRLKDLATKSNIDNFVKGTDSDKKLKNINKKATLNKS